jgi:hypothetical protein
VARVTFELLRPVPIAPLSVSTETLRDGKKVQLVAASLRAGESEVVRATALRIRRAEIALPDDLTTDDGRPDLPAATEELVFPFAADSDQPAFHRDGVEIRAVAGGFDRPGPGTAWFRLKAPLVAGEPTSPAALAVALADFGNGLSWVLPPGWVFINPDLTVHLLREPVGEWLCLASRTLPSSGGTGVAESAIYDERGRVGRSVQSLLVEAPG